MGIEEMRSELDLIGWYSRLRRPENGGRQIYLDIQPFNQLAVVVPCVDLRYIEELSAFYPRIYREKISGHAVVWSDIGGALRLSPKHEGSGEPLSQLIRKIEELLSLQGIGDSRLDIRLGEHAHNCRYCLGRRITYAAALERIEEAINNLKDCFPYAKYFVDEHLDLGSDKRKTYELSLRPALEIARSSLPTQTI